MAAADYSTVVQQLYVAYFGRPADTLGASNYAAQLDALGAPTTLVGLQESTNPSIQTLINSFGTSAESVALYGTDTVAFVSAIYTNVLGRTADFDGLVFWANAINAGTLTKSGAAIAIMNGALTNTTAQGLIDAATVTNKVTVAANFTASIDTSAELLAYSGDTAAATARTMLGTVTSATDTTAFQTTVTSTVAGLVTTYETAAAAGSTFTLTTGVDTLTGTAKNDTFNATLLTADSTLNSFDSINGGDGTDTLNITATKADAAFAMPGSVTISGIETVNLNRSGVATNTLAVTNTTFGTGVQSFSVTDTGNNGAGAYGITLASAKSVSVVSTATALGAVTVTDTDATSTTTQGSLLNTVTVTKAASAAINGNGVTTVNINAVAGATVITSAAGTRALALNASGTTNQGAVTDAEATSAVVTVSGAQTLGLVTVAKATAVTINTNAAATTSIAAAVATTLNLGGTNLNTLTINGATVAVTSVVITGAGGVAADLSGITALTSVDTTGSTAAAPSSGVLTGTNKLTIGTGVTFTGGAGQDVVTVGATTKAITLGAGNDTANVSVTALGTGGSIDGGTGTNTLGLSNANAVTLSTTGSAAFKAAVTNFTSLDIGTQTAGTISLSAFGTFDTVKFTSDAAAQVFSGATSGLTIVDTYDAAGTSVTTNNLSGASDVMNLTLKGDLSGGARAFGTFVLPGVETVNITTLDTNTTFTTRLATMTLTDANATTINVSGNNGLALTHNGTALTTFNASGVTKGGVTFSSVALTTDATVTGSTSGGDTLNFASAIAKVTITETAGTNSIIGSSTIASTLTGGTGNDTITGGNGNDVIVVGAGTTGNTVTGGAGADSINLTGSSGVDTIKYAAQSTTAAAAGANMDTITAFVSGSDKINLTISVATDASSSYGLKDGAAVAGTSNVATVAFTTAITDATSVATVADVYTALATDLTSSAFVASTALASGINAKLVTFSTGAAAGTYLVLNDGVAAFQAANDMVIKLVGGTTVVASDFSYTVVA